MPWTKVTSEVSSEDGNSIDNSAKSADGEYSSSEGNQRYGTDMNVFVELRVEVADESVHGRGLGARERQRHVTRVVDRSPLNGAKSALRVRCRSSSC